MDAKRPELQKLSFFTEGNFYTGSKTKDAGAGTVLRYLVRPDAENGELDVFSWERDVCFDLATEKREKRFPMTQEGLEQAHAWLSEQYEALPESGGF